MNTSRIYEKIKGIFTGRGENQVVETNDGSLVVQEWRRMAESILVMIADGDGTGCLLYEGLVGPETGRIVEERRLEWIASKRSSGGEFALDHRGPFGGEGGLLTE